MRYQVKMMSGDIHFITEAEFKNLSTLEDKSGLVFVPSINGCININSIETVINEDKIPLVNRYEIDLGGGLVAVKKFGSWVNKNNPDVKIDLHKYPQLTKDEVKELPPLNRPNNK